MLALACVGLTSCSSTNQLFKARPVALSPFIERPTEMISYRERLPFHKIWWPRDPQVIARASSRSGLYVAPVRLEYLRPVNRMISRQEVEFGGVERQEREIASLLRNEFGRAFLRSENARYHLSKTPDKDSVTLELALVELNPTSPKGNAVKTGLGFMFGPLASLTGYFTKGNIAIEGKLRDTKTGQLLFQFADNECDKLTLYSLRDFHPYGHATAAIQEWAEQFESFTRTRADQRIGDSSCLTLDPRAVSVR